MTKKNVVMIVVDQMRFDCLKASGNPYISTPTLDMFAKEGCQFTNAYSSVPTCVPARASLLTGLKPKNHRRVGYQDGIPWEYEKTLPQTFKDLGYQTECIGKMHVYPERNRLGYEHVELHDGYLHYSRKANDSYNHQYENIDDYLYWLKQQQGVATDLIDSGLDCNSWDARPWPLREELHPTNWVATKSIEFLRRRDPTKPFFLKMSFTHPHAPLDPPQYYFDLYQERLKNVTSFFELGQWEQDFHFGEVTSNIAMSGKLDLEDQKRMIAAYYGSITHIDHQINRFYMRLIEYGLQANTIILFVSDHGDQLGEHDLLRKGYPYQGSIHIPLLVYSAGNHLQMKEHCSDTLVELRDIFPSLVDLATGKAVDGIDGHSFKDSLYEKGHEIHEYLHGEHALGNFSSQFILTKEWKYIWLPYYQKEQLFHLTEDPTEKVDVIAEEKYEKVKNQLKEILINELKDREEGFVEEGQLQKPKFTTAYLKK